MPWAWVHCKSFCSSRPLTPCSLSCHSSSPCRSVHLLLVPNMWSYHWRLVDQTFRVSQLEKTVMYVPTLNFWVGQVVWPHLSEVLSLKKNHKLQGSTVSVACVHHQGSFLHGIHLSHPQFYFSLNNSAALKHMVSVKHHSHMGLESMFCSHWGLKPVNKSAMKAYIADMQASMSTSHKGLLLHLPAIKGYSSLGVNNIFFHFSAGRSSQSFRCEHHCHS